MSLAIGPRNSFSQQLHAEKYRQNGETFDDFCVRYARTTCDDESHFRKLLEGLRTQAILPAGRQQRAVGWPFLTTAFNCFVGGVIPDDMKGIMEALTDGAMTLRSGGGCGWDFSTLRPEGELIRKLGEGARASGPVSFMGMWNAMCKTIRSAGERRGAMMGVIRVDHPEIMKFIRAKQNESDLTCFNISVGTTDEFMEAVEHDKLFPLKFGGTVFNDVRALDLWAQIMENNWDWAEPGVLFIDVINRMNPLRYCETIYATNPCGEQPLPPHGACLLLSHNMVMYLVPTHHKKKGYEIDFDKLKRHVDVSVRACDNVFEHTVFPLEQQRKEAFDKRRMGVGVTGMANALEMCGYRYGSPAYIEAQSHILEVIRDTAYRTSIDMAKKKGPFPLFDADKWLASGFAQTLPEDIRHGIKKHGLRNGLLLSIAPTGTISWTADNVSSGIEAPLTIEGEREVFMNEGKRTVPFNDWAFEEHGIRCKTALECTPDEHINVLCAAQRYVDSSISKTTNVRGAKKTPTEEGHMSYKDFKELYMKAYKGGAKGCSTFNINGKRAGIIREAVSQGEADNDSCYITPDGEKVCG